MVTFSYPFRLRSVFGPIFENVVRGGKTKYFILLFIGASATKGQEFFSMGCLKIFIVEGKNQAGVGGGWRKAIIAMRGNI